MLFVDFGGVFVDDYLSYCFLSPLYGRWQIENKCSIAWWETSITLLFPITPIPIKLYHFGVVGNLSIRNAGISMRNSIISHWIALFKKTEKKRTWSTSAAPKTTIANAIDRNFAEICRQARLRWKDREKHSLSQTFYSRYSVCLSPTHKMPENQNISINNSSSSLPPLALRFLLQSNTLNE